MLLRDKPTKRGKIWQEKMNQIIRAARLKTPNGIDFWAFIDTEGEIKNISDAYDVTDHGSTLLGMPLVVVYLENGEHKFYGNAQCAQFLSTLPLSSLVFEPVLLTSGILKPKTN